MPQVKCPECGAIAQMAMNTPYCAKCGWNRDGAIRRLARFAWLLPAPIVFFDAIGILGVGFAMHDWPGAILTAALPTLLLGFVYAGVRQGLTRLRAPSADLSPASFDATAQSATAAENSEQYDFLISLPPPRPVRLSRRGKRLLNLLLAFVFVMEAFLVWSAYRAWQHSATISNARGLGVFLVCFIVLVAAVPFFIRRGMVRDKSLIESGALAMGHVMTQKTVKNASLITYEFRDAGGLMVTGSGNDLGRSFYPQMTIPVFYDEKNPKRNLAACASFFEIAAPSE